MPRSRELEDLQARLGHRFADPGLLETALTHRSFAYEQDLGGNYERLEFLGDAVLGLLAADWLYGHLPDHPEGELSKLKSFLVSEAVLAAHAEGLGIGEVLRLGVGEERSGGRSKPSILADAMEAVLGGVYVDAGLEAARRVLEPFLEEAMTYREEIGFEDAKTRLQELAQGRGWELPVYRHVAESGPEHRKLFTAECWVAGDLAGVGEGRTKKLAEQRAAAAALSGFEAP